MSNFCPVGIHRVFHQWIFLRNSHQLFLENFFSIFGKFLEKSWKKPLRISLWTTVTSFRKIWLNYSSRLKRKSLGICLGKLVNNERSMNSAQWYVRIYSWRKFLKESIANFLKCSQTQERILIEFLEYFLMKFLEWLLK